MFPNPCPRTAPAANIPAAMRRSCGSSRKRVRRPSNPLTWGGIGEGENGAGGTVLRVEPACFGVVTGDALVDDRSTKGACPPARRSPWSPFSPLPFHEYGVRDENTIGRSRAHDSCGLAPVKSSVFLAALIGLVVVLLR